MEKEYTIESVDVTPYFDLELFLSLCDTRRIEGDTFDKLAGYWEKWLPMFHAEKVGTGAADYLVCWLDEEIEKEIDTKWAEQPTESFMINALAQTMLMSALRSLLPEIERAGCAPVPKPTLKLKQALMDMGLNWIGEKQLSRRYAMVSHFPFKGGCEICYLVDDCPKMKGGAKTINIGQSAD